MAVFAYRCVGNNEQTIENQRAEFERAGYQVDYVYVDKGADCKVSALQRPGFANMLRQVGNADILVVGKLDCLGCNAQEVQAAVAALTAHRLAIYIMQLGRLDLASDAGKPMLAMLAALAEMGRNPAAEPAQTSKVTGKQPGRPTKTTAGQRTEIVTEYSKGCSVSELARRYHVSRASILAIVAPKRSLEAEPLRSGWGD